MMGTKANPGKYDCYAKAEPDEPIFTLMGRDRHGPALVWLWAVMRELDEEPPEVVQDGRDCSVAMMKWAVQHGRQCVGVSQALLAGILELIRAANYAFETQAKKPDNAPVTVEEVRALLMQMRAEKLP